MPPQSSGLAPITFTDFRPGIADNPGVNYPPEQAQRTNTYRCYANPSGALIPGPRKQSDFTIVGTHWESSMSGVVEGIYLVNGFYIAGPVQGTPPSSYSDEAFVGVEYLKSGNKEHRLELCRLYLNPEIKTTIKTATTADASSVLVGWGMTFGTTRSNKASPTTVGIPIVVAAWGTGNLGGGPGYVITFPNDATPTSDTPYSVLTGGAPSITVHQGRIVIWFQSGYNHGASGAWDPSEDLKWTDVNNPSVLSTLQAFVPESPDGYSAIVAMSANELFALKSSFGVMFAGDLDNPTVINLPMVVGKVLDSGAVITTPLGVMYGSNWGVWLWSHGDSSRSLSPNMNSEFWYVLEQDRLNAARSSWANLFSKVFIGNNFFYDILTTSWWRLEDDGVFTGRFFRADWSKRYLYGVKSTYTNESDVIGYRWDTHLGASSYSWQSHPIWQSLDRHVEVNEIELIAKGTGQVTLSLTALDNTAKSTVVLLANTGYPERFRTKLSVQGRFMQLRVESDSGNIDIEAPTVYSVVLHPDARARIGVS